MGTRRMFAILRCSCSSSNDRSRRCWPRTRSSRCSPSRQSPCIRWGKRHRFAIRSCSCSSPEDRSHRCPLCIRRHPRTDLGQRPRTRLDKVRRRAVRQSWCKSPVDRIHHCSRRRRPRRPLPQFRPLPPSLTSDFPLRTCLPSTPCRVDRFPVRRARPQTQRHSGPMRLRRFLLSFRWYPPPPLRDHPLRPRVIPRFRQAAVHQHRRSQSMRTVPTTEPREHHSSCRSHRHSQVILESAGLTGRSSALKNRGFMFATVVSNPYKASSCCARTWHGKGRSFAGCR